MSKDGITDAMTDERALAVLGQAIACIGMGAKVREALDHIAARLAALPPTRLSNYDVWTSPVDALPLVGEGDLIVQARELLAAESERDGERFTPEAMRKGGWDNTMFIRAILAALRAKAGAGVPEGMVDRIKSAMDRIQNNHAPRRIPADPTDVDLVLAEVLAHIEGRPAPFWITRASAPQPDKEVQS
jgi:hypothetical protein